ncbi:MAG: putative Zn peptidase [Phycisphaerales bacterium]|nr:putative Zn peptidase [Phycisphaerales bacterium]
MSGLDVRFLDVPSLEGMFVRDPGLRVLLPSLKHRPRSRVLFSCAHEIGHHQFGHGTKADEYLAEAQSPAFSDEEFLAESFARHLLMPRAAVLDAFQRRNWDSQSPAAQQVYQVSGELGVGYETLLNHMSYSLELISRVERDRLAKTTPKALQLELTGDPAIRKVVVVDLFWNHVPIDAECGEIIIFPANVGANCPLLSPLSNRENVSVYTASKAGQGSIVLGGNEVTVRVARQHYIGPYLNRYLPDPDEH